MKLITPKKRPFTYFLAHFTKFIAFFDYLLAMLKLSVLNIFKKQHFLGGQNDFNAGENFTTITISLKNILEKLLKCTELLK